MHVRSPASVYRHGDSPPPLLCITCMWHALRRSSQSSSPSSLQQQVRRHADCCAQRGDLSRSQVSTGSAAMCGDRRGDAGFYGTMTKRSLWCPLRVLIRHRADHFIALHGVDQTRLNSNPQTLRPGRDLTLCHHLHQLQVKAGAAAKVETRRSKPSGDQAIKSFPVKARQESAIKAVRNQNCRNQKPSEIRARSDSKLSGKRRMRGCT
jgi:hypothetical protein